MRIIALAVVAASSLFGCTIGDPSELELQEESHDATVTSVTFDGQAALSVADDLAPERTLRAPAAPEARERVRDVLELARPRRPWFGVVRDDGTWRPSVERLCSIRYIDIYNPGRKTVEQVGEIVCP